MSVSFLTVQVLTALREAAFLFLISSGLTLVFGVLNILNFAHGALYMLGAYLAYGITLYLVGPAGFLLAGPDPNYCIGSGFGAQSSTG